MTEAGKGNWNLTVDWGKRENKRWRQIGSFGQPCGRGADVWCGCLVHKLLVSLYSWSSAFGGQLCGVQLFPSVAVISIQVLWTNLLSYGGSSLKCKCFGVEVRSDASSFKYKFARVWLRGVFRFVGQKSEILVCPGWNWIADLQLDSPAC